MKDLLEGFVVAFSMYSKLPMPRITWTKNNMKYCVCFFPLIGLVIGGLMYGWCLLADHMGYGNLLRTVVLALIPLAVTGGIHLDGLLDTADALSSYKPMEEKLKILKDSHAGAFAIIIGIAWFLLYLGALSELGPEEILLLVPGFVLSRAWSGLGLVSLKKARNSGLLYTFADAAANHRVAGIMTAYILAASFAMVWLSPAKGGILVILTALSYLWYRYLSYSKFGGITGDLAGFFLQTAELVMALACALIGGWL